MAAKLVLSGETHRFRKRVAEPQNVLVEGAKGHAERELRKWRIHVLEPGVQQAHCYVVLLVYYTKEAQMRQAIQFEF